MQMEAANDSYHETVLKSQMENPNNSDHETVPKPQVVHRCKKCRRIVAAEESIVPHQRGKGEQCFKWKKRSSNPWETDKEPPECSSIFVEPMKWMETGEFKLSFFVLLLLFFFFAIAMNTSCDIDANFNLIG